MDKAFLKCVQLWNARTVEILFMMIFRAYVVGIFLLHAR